METKSYTTIDRKGWPSGPWDNEPDKMQWQDKTTGLPCLAVRQSWSGHWCGYVGVPEGHPCYNHGYDDEANNDLDVHGGLTFASLCQPHEDESTGVCHVPALSETDKVWWLGFDCAHCGDLHVMDFKHREDAAAWKGGHYRMLAYVQQQCASLAAQLKAMG